MGRWGIGSPGRVLALALVLLLAAVIAAPVDHDESQYVAAVAAMRHGLPYRDFAYLQTPLQPLLLAPMAMLPPGWLVAGLRLVNAAAALATLALVGMALRRAGAGRTAAGAAVLLMAGGNAFLFAGSLARNDALPMLFFAGGLVLALGLVEGRRGFALAGLLLGAAVSTKISYALPAAATGAALLAMRVLTGRRLVAFTLGGVGGVAPTLVLAALAPEAAWFGIVDYSLIAPQQWQRLLGQPAMLSPLAKLARLAGFAALGAPLIAFAAVVAERARRRTRPDRRLVLLDAAIAGAALAAFLPDPTYRQYLVPLLPPLFLRFGLMLAAGTPRRWQRGALAMFCIAGLVPTAVALVTTVRSGSPLAAVIRDAHAVRAIVGGVPIATLAPERVVGAGAAIDPRFIAGPFLFRIQPPAADRIPAQWHAIGIADMPAALDAAPPRALLTGSETRPFAGHPRGLDGVLEDWARRRGYARRALPSGRMALWVAGSRSTSSLETR